MSNITDQFIGWALAATGAVLAVAAVATVILLSPLSTSPAAGATPQSTTVSARHTQLGTILVGPGGETLYAYSRDGRDHDACAMVRGCLQTWPILAQRGQLRAGRGVSRSRLSTIKVGDHRQVTYAGHPLYTFADDSRPGDTGYVGTQENGGSWPAVRTSGSLVR